jgi:hypothetical protein
LLRIKLENLNLSKSIALYKTLNFFPFTIFFPNLLSPALIEQARKKSATNLVGKLKI